MLCSALSCLAQQDGGGRDISVALFSTLPPRSITVAASGPQAWWALCATCRHQSFTTPLHIPAVHEVFAGGPLTVRDEEHAQVRTADGRWHLRSESQGNIDVVLTLPSERYVAAVLMGETPSGEPQESLRAMAIVARTIAMRAVPARSTSSQLPSDICDSTACQDMRLGPVSSAVREAVRSTAGKTLWWGSQRAQVFFSGSCGGTTESAGAMWPELAHVPYLRSIQDPYCVRKDRASWHAEIPLAEIQQIAMREGWHIPSHIASAQVIDRTSSLRSRTIAFTDDSGKQSLVSAPALRLAVGRSLGWNLIRSDAYDLRVRNGILVLDGHGHGHGVGLCQQGATEMARMGRSYREILAFYFPGTKVRVTSTDEGWKQGSQEDVRFASTIALKPPLIESAVSAWKIAKSSFPPREQVIPEVIFAPSTELFRQMTLQPGWQLASTAGATITLQPLSVFAANSASLATTLQHEMLHVAVEMSTNEKTPLWLREGMVEVLAGDAPRTPPSLSVADTERLLQNANSRHESEAAHRAAAARTRQLLEHYGMSTVRGWIIGGSSVPTD
ncbi:SpoIID/LytB domain-containing protein [Silvibacterium dinghuense]|nr:SpoIID/LytB domain-containing protein [Silvibacterium dinghuense]